LEERKIHSLRFKEKFNIKNEERPHIRLNNEAFNEERYYQNLKENRKTEMDVKRGPAVSSDEFKASLEESQLRHE